MNESDPKTNGRAGGFSESTIARLAARAHEAVDSVAKSAEHLERSVRARATQAADAAQESEHRAAEQLTDSARRTRIYLRRNPLIGVGIGFVAGAVLTSLFRK